VDIAPYRAVENGTQQAFVLVTHGWLSQEQLLLSIGSGQP
jgi:hypothetical protein